MIRSFHPQHLSDLRKSGLHDGTIDAAGIYTVPPGEIDKKLGGLGNNVVSAMAFPYPGFDGYERFKVWREVDKPGPKYLQKTGTPNHLYLPPKVDLNSGSHLLIVEGEKKALALLQAGYHVAGISGVFSWLTKVEGGDSRPIFDFDLLNWKRPVTILFDSDGADNSNVRLAAWRLAREVAKRGAQVDLLFFPPGTNAAKVGADDFLVEHGPESLSNLLKTAWPFDQALNDYEAEISWQTKDLAPETPLPEKLKRLSYLTPILARLSNTEVAAALENLRELLKLRTSDLAGLKGDIKAVRNARKNKGKNETSKVKDLEETFRLHPAIDFLGSAMSIGFRVNLPENNTGLLLLFSDGQWVRAEVNPESVDIGERVYQLMQNTAPPFLQDVWDLSRLKAFLERPSRPKSLFKDLKEAFAEYLDLPGPAYGLLAAWALGTYFAHLFTAFPFLQFHGPKECGKSKSLEALRFVSFNAWKGRDITPAALGDTADGQRGTLLFDQAEKLSCDKESGNLIGLLADSYKKGGGKRRVVEITKAGRSVLEFSTYGPKAFASTKNLDPDLADRCIKIRMTRTRRPLPDLEGWEPVWGELRDNIYRFTLAAFKEVRGHYEVNPGNGTRIGELWRPILAVLLTLGGEQAEIEEIRGLFMDGAEEGAHELTSWECILFEILKEKAESETDNFEMTAEEVLKAMDIEEEHKPGVNWAGNTLSKFSLFSKRLPRKYTDDRRRKVQPYLFIPVHVLKMYEIYMRDTPQNDPSQASQTDNANDTKMFYGTKGNPGTCPEASQEGEKDDLGRNGTGQEKGNRPLEPYGITKDSSSGLMGREESGSPPEKNINLFSGEEVEL